MWQYHSLTSQRQCLENLGKSLYDWPTNSKTLKMVSFFDYYLSLCKKILYINYLAPEVLMSRDSHNIIE